jgi:DNA-binding CsgD family transcriptional regulator
MVVSIGGILLFIMGVILYFWKRREIVRRNEIELQKERLINEKNQQAIRSKNEILEIRRMEEFKVDSMRADVIEQLNSLKPLIKEKEVRDRINQICNEIEKSKEGDLWEEISQYIPEFNSEFFQRLTQDFPTLSVNERRLCAFLNLNLSTKEISEITRQSPHSINIARGRLRKKLGLTGSELSIQEFLTKYNQQTTEQ